MLQYMEKPHLISQKMMLSGESTAIIEYEGDIVTHGTIIYGTGSEIVSSESS